jgi:hypothetical protein
MNGDRDVQRTYQVRRMEVFARLVSDHRLRLLDAEHWVRAWEAKAEDLGRPRTSEDFWQEGWRWIVGEMALDRPESH